MATRKEESNNEDKKSKHTWFVEDSISGSGNGKYAVFAQSDIKKDDGGLYPIKVLLKNSYRKDGDKEDTVVLFGIQGTSAMRRIAEELTRAADLNDDYFGHVKRGVNVPDNMTRAGAEET